MHSLTNPLTSLVRRLQLHSSLTGAEEAAVLALPTTLRTLEPGQYVVREGDRPTQCCVVVSGFAIRHKVGNDGARQIVNIHMAGDLADLQNSLLDTADHNVQALSRMVGAFIPREAIVDLAFAHSTVGKALWVETLIEGSIAREWIMNVGRRMAGPRIAHILCEFAFRLDAIGMGRTCNYELPMTQEQLADAVGLTPVHVNRTLKSLTAAGLITMSRRCVGIRDLAELAAFGDFRSTYLHLPREALPQYLQ